MNAANQAKTDPGGPLCVTGTVRVEMPDGEVREMSEAAFCRCGRSQDKPFCDGSHVPAGFEDDGLIEGGRLAPSEGGDGGPVMLSCAPNGPLLVRGPLTVVAEDGRTASGAKGALCRCGASATKPFCDGTHRRTGFEAE